MEIPLVDIKAQYELIKSEIDSVVAQVISEGAFIGGEYVKKFEEEFGSFCGARNCVGVGNGTDALFIALKCLGIGQGDEVIVPANTFIATAEAVTLCGAKVVFVDCDSESYTINIESLNESLTAKTQAIIPVHLYGHPADMSAIREIANRFQIKIIQDCAQAHGAEINGNKLIEYGDILCFSFYPGKNLGAYGDAGAIVTNDEDLSIKIRKFANHGRISKYDHEIEGVNSRMDAIQGAILSVKLKYLSDWTEKRIEIAKKYSAYLGSIENTSTPLCCSRFKHVYHLYVIRSKKRDALKDHLYKKGVLTGIHYPVSLPNLEAYKYLQHSPEDFPVSNQLQNEILSLPLYPELDDEKVEYVTRVIIDFLS